MANPAASSFALFILMPVKRRSIDCDDFKPFERNDPCAESAEIFELMVNATIYVIKVGHFYKQYLFQI